MWSPDEAVEAWHEAAHAVVARLLGAHVRSVTLEADEDEFGGRTEIAWPPLPEAELASRSATVALAGPLAELERFGDEDPGDPRVLAAWEADWAEVERCAAIAAGDGDARLRAMRAWMGHALALLRDHGVDRVVARVADALEAHGTLDDALFEDCL